MGKIILAHGVIYPSFLHIHRAMAKPEATVWAQRMENAQLMLISQPVLWRDKPVIPNFLWKTTNLKKMKYISD